VNQQTLDFFFWLGDNSTCIDVIKPHTREKMKRNRNELKKKEEYLKKTVKVNAKTQFWCCLIHSSVTNAFTVQKTSDIRFNKIKLIKKKVRLQEG